LRGSFTEKVQSLVIQSYRTWNELVMITFSYTPTHLHPPSQAITRCLSEVGVRCPSAQTSMQNIKYVRIGRPRRGLYQDPSLAMTAISPQQRNGRDSTETDHMGEDSSFSSLSHICAWTIMTSGPIRRYRDCGDLSQTTRGSRVQDEEEGNSSHQAPKPASHCQQYKLPRQC
jgi:hypothetical protein